MSEQEYPEHLRKSWTEWFEIPASDLHRAKSFYEAIFNTEIDVIDAGPIKMGIFPHKQVGCALCEHEMYAPGDQGPLIYLNANPDLNDVLCRIESNGGKVVVPKKQISPDHGYMAVFIDSEGNRLALHSYQ